MKTILELMQAEFPELDIQSLTHENGLWVVQLGPNRFVKARSLRHVKHLLAEDG